MINKWNKTYPYNVYETTRKNYSNTNSYHALSVARKPASSFTVSAELLSVRWLSIFSPVREEQDLLKPIEIMKQRLE